MKSCMQLRTGVVVDNQDLSCMAILSKNRINHPTQIARALVAEDADTDCKHSGFFDTRYERIATRLTGRR